MKINKKIYKAKEFRKNGTKSERILWKYVLKNNKYHWKKQRIQNGYITDFYCVKLKLIIEVDGETHDTEENIIYDKSRSNIMEKKGYNVIRIRNEDIQTIIYEVGNYLNLLFDERYKELYG